MYNRIMRTVVSVVVLSLGVLLPASSAFPQTPAGTYDNSLVIAPLFVEYQNVSDQEFSNHVQQLKTQIPAAPYVKVGFATFVSLGFPDVPINQPLDPSAMAADLANIDTVVDRARTNGIILHISLISGFFHGVNPLRFSAI